MPVASKKSYSLQEINNEVRLVANRGGRIFFSFDTPIEGTNPPEPNNPSLPSYHTRFDKIELTYDANDPSSVANLTTIDFFAIPFLLKTYKNEKLVNSLGFSVKGNTVINKLTALCENNPNIVIKEKGKFLRIMGPSNDGAANFYPSMESYINFARATKTTLNIADQYSHLGDTAATTSQKYNFFGNLDEQGNLIFYGGAENIGEDHTITIYHDDLLQGIYSCNPKYYVDGVEASIGDNDVYSAVVRDALVGFDLGFVASSTINPKTGLAFKDSPSADWWSSPLAFEYLQPTQSFYNLWAKHLFQCSNSYSFPFSDLWQKVQIPLADIDTLEIIILEDAETSKSFWDIFGSFLQINRKEN